VHLAVQQTICVAQLQPTVCVEQHAATAGTALILIFILNRHHLMRPAILNLVQSTRPVCARAVRTQLSGS
jgi:hypothetical protein